jgi:hypothetical protein
MREVCDAVSASGVPNAAIVLRVKGWVRGSWPCASTTAFRDREWHNAGGWRRYGQSRNGIRLGAGSSSAGVSRHLSGCWTELLSPRNTLGVTDSPARTGEAAGLPLQCNARDTTASSANCNANTPFWWEWKNRTMVGTQPARMPLFLFQAPYLNGMDTSVKLQKLACKALLPFGRGSATCSGPRPVSFCK